MEYLLKSSALLILFYLGYHLCLKRETFFESNRWFLLSGLLVAMSVPFIVIPNYIEYSIVESTNFSITTNSFETIPLISEERTFDYIQFLFRTYILGTLFFFGKLVIELISLNRILNTATLKSDGKFKLLETTEIVAPFSFFNRIVYNPNQFKTEELAHVINHEEVHAQQYHSIDTVIAQIACVLFWFNPFIWLYKKSLQQNLEFIADQKAQYISSCNKSYQTVLLKASVANHHMAITNNFYTSLIKKRIVMLHKSKSKPINRLKLLVVLPFLAIFMMSYAVKDIYIEVPEEDTNTYENSSDQSHTVEIIITKDTSDDELKEIQKALKEEGVRFTYDNLKRNDKGEITAITTEFKSKDNSANFSLNGDEPITPFLFKSNGESFSVGTSNSENTNSFSHETDTNKTKVHTSTTGSKVYVVEEVEDENTEDVEVIVKTSEDNNNVFFKKANSGGTWISTDGTTTQINASENGNSNLFFSQSDDPIFIINGKAVSKSLFEDVDSEDIESVDVLKGNAAVKTYGSKGENGVIVMRTKSSNSLFDKKVDTSYEFIHTDGELPLYIVDGKVLSKGQFKDLNPSEIDNIEVIKNKKAIKVYGDKAKNGAVIITSKDGLTTIGQGKPIIVEIAEDSPKTFKTAITSVYYVDDNDTESIEFIVSKNATDAFLNQQKRELKAKGIDAKFSKVRRNKAGEITSIKIALDDNKGRKSSASWKEKEQAIPDIVLGKSGDKLFIRAIGR